MNALPEAVAPSVGPLAADCLDNPELTRRLATAIACWGARSTWSAWTPAA